MFLISFITFKRFKSSPAPFTDSLVYPDIENEFRQILKNGVHAASKPSQDPGSWLRYKETEIRVIGKLGDLFRTSIRVVTA